MNHPHLPTQKHPVRMDGSRLACVLVIWNLVMVILALAMPANALISSFFDDFYYYVVIVRHWIESGTLSFDGTHLTNGFHPLWFALLALAYALLPHPESNLLVFTFVLQSVLASAGTWGFYLYLRQRFQHAPTQAYLGWAALIYFSLAFKIAYGGMETALTLGLLPWLLWMAHQPAATVMRFGLFTLLAALVVCSRLDSVIIVAPIWLFHVIKHQLHHPLEGASLARMPKLLVAAVSGGMPLLAYIALNWLHFGAPMPQSASAKALTTEPGPYFELVTMFAQGFALLIGGLWLVFFALYLRRLGKYMDHAWVDLSVLVWPAVFYAMLAWRSPWPLWPWYAYPMVVAAALGTVVYFLSSHHAGTTRWLVPLAAALLLAFPVRNLVVLDPLNPTPNIHSLHAAAQRLQAFEKTHPGRYAMGDRAGIAGYLMTSPILQLEGLVGGKTTLDAIDKEANLLAVMKQHGVNYYIATNLETTTDGCFVAQEPAQGGEQVKRMRARLCQEPVLRFQSSDNKGTVDTLVFAVD